MPARMGFFQTRGSGDTGDAFLQQCPSAGQVDSVGNQCSWLRTGEFGEVGMHGVPGIEWRDNVYLTYTCQGVSIYA